MVLHHISLQLVLIQDYHGVLHDKPPNLDIEAKT